MSELSTRREYLKDNRVVHWDQKEEDGVIRITVMGLNAPRILRYRNEKLIEAK
jgi:hypothetical protein